MRDGRGLARTGHTPYPSDMTEHLDPALVDIWFAAWSRSRGYRTSQEAGRRAALRTPRPARMIPGGSDIGGTLQQLQEIGQKHGKEAEGLVMSAVDEIKKVLSSKMEEAQKLKDKAEKDVKKST